MHHNLSDPESFILIGIIQKKVFTVEDAAFVNLEENHVLDFCCFLVPPAVDGGWTDWSDWSPCPPCAHSVTTRTRTCTDPAPAFGGSTCDDASRMDQLCTPSSNCDGKFCSIFTRYYFITRSVKLVIENTILWSQFLSVSL